jgi:secreted Zn-dependent insulinase-like peptidase
MLGACQWLPDYQLRSNGVIKSVGDTREYRYIELPNQLKVLLIHDPLAERAAASLDLNVGSRHDPQRRQGLAHFLEHMLFLGTKKYPEINGYQAFIAEHGGSTNAFTSFEHTNYYFYVDHHALSSALDRFADFFIHPTFSPDYIEREINAVEAEFRSRYSQDSMRIVDATREIVSPQHPYKKFNVGSLESLRSPGLRDELVDFYRRYYSASRMSLAVAGSYSLEELEALVRLKFSAIPNTAEKTVQLTEKMFVSDRVGGSALPKILSVQTNKPLRKLVLSFPLPDLKLHFQTKPMQYIGNVLGDEGPGSLLSALKKEQLVEGLSTGVGIQYSGGALFQVQLSLTEKGVENIADIVGGVFAVVERIRHEHKTAPAAMHRRYKEQRDLAAMAFRFYQPPALQSAVLHFSSSMHYYPWQWVVAGGYNYAHYNAELILEFCDYLRVDNMLITVAAQQLPVSLAVDQVSTHYKTPYGEHSVPALWQKNWNNLQTNGLFEQIKLPLENPFIANDFSLHHWVEDVDEKSGVIDQQPQLVNEEPGARLWWQLDGQFKTPKAAFYLALLTGQHKKSARNQMLTALYISVVNDQLAEQVYPAYLAGVNYSFYRHQRGLSLKLKGYNQSLQPLLAQLAPAIVTIDTSEARLNELADVLARQWRGAMQAQPHRQLGNELAQQLLPNRANYQQLLDEVNSVSLTELKVFVKQLLQSSYIEMLGHGNLSITELQALQKIVAKLPNCGCEYRAENYRAAERVLSGRQRQTLKVEHNDVAALWYFQAPAEELEDQVATMLLARMVHAEFYTELRTQQQLGYVVGASYQKLAQIPALGFVVQSPHASSATVIQAMDAFVAQFVLRGAAVEAFERHKAAFLADLLEPDRTLFARSGRYWQALAKGDATIEPVFERRQQLAAVLKAMDYSQWQPRMRQTLNPDRGSMLLIASPAL